jgi:bacillithiol system protein YtxJ
LENVEPWYLDLIAYRNVSNAIALQLGVQHESPQAILLKDGIVVYDSSHNSISVSEIAKGVS